jgi:hypothetical protein
MFKPSRLVMSHGTMVANSSGGNATWYIEIGCGPTSSSCQRPMRTGKRFSIRSRTVAATGLVLGL